MRREPICGRCAGEDMRDMMSTADMIGLGSAGGADFDRMFLTMLKP